MFDDRNKNFETRVLDRYPKIRKSVLGSRDFIIWRESLPSVVVDDEKLYIRGGDMLRDEDQVIFEWARTQGLLSEALIAQVDEPQGGNIGE